MGKVTLVRPDGSTVSVDDTDAGHLRTLGYQEQTIEQETGAAVAKGTEEFYSTPGQKVLTGVEGALGGATLGLSDLAFDAMGFDTAERAGYNPGIRLGSEIVGGLAGLSPLGKFTPVGLLESGAAGIAKALPVGKATQTGIRMGIEGGGFGAGASITNAVVNGDPITAESIMAGVGWGSVWGGGLGLMAGKVAARIEAKAAAKAAMEEAAAATLRETDEAWGAFRGSIKDISEQLGKVEKVSESALKEALDDADKLRNGFLNDTILTQAERNWESTGVKSTISATRKEAVIALNKAKSAAKNGKYEALQEHLSTYQEHLKSIAAEAGVGAPELSGFAALSAKQSIAGAKSLTEAVAANEVLKKTALTPQAFSAMQSERAEKLFGAVDTFLSQPAAELKGAQDSLKAGIERLQQAIGATFDGPPSTQLRGVWETLKHQKTVKAAEETASALSGAVPWAKSALGYAAGRKGADLARRFGGGGIAQSVGYEAGKKLAHGLMGVKAAVVGGIAKATTEWAPRAVTKVAPAFSRLEPLVTRLDGTVDARKRTRLQLMEDRAAEIRAAAGSVRDTLYKGVAPLAEAHPDLAAAMHEAGVKQFMFLMNKLPRDPGNAFNRLQSLWKPDPAEIEKFARYYQTFQNPVGVIQQVLKTGRCTPEWAEGLREMHPALFAQLRVDMLERLSSPKILGRLSYSEQVSLGTLLAIPIHSTLTPQFVAAQQQMYVQKNQKLGISPQPGADGGGGRPPGDVSGATQAQKIGEH